MGRAATAASYVEKNDESRLKNDEFRLKTRCLCMKTQVMYSCETVDIVLGFCRPTIGKEWTAGKIYTLAVQVL